MESDSDGSDREERPRSAASKRNRKPCSVEGCSTLAQVRGLCMPHGGSSSRKPCSVEGCSTLSASRGLCGKHGGRTRCREEGCEKQAQAGGLCIAHGGCRDR
jgi:hypothetical protein